MHYEFGIAPYYSIERWLGVLQRARAVRAEYSFSDITYAKHNT